MQRPPDDALYLVTWNSRRIHHWHPRATLSLQLLIPKQRTLPPLQAILLAEGTLNLTVQITSATPSITLSTTPAKHLELDLS